MLDKDQIMSSQEDSTARPHGLTMEWWRHQMETFSALLSLCTGNSPVAGEFRSQRPVTRSIDVFFDLHLNKRLSKQPWARWFETPLCPLWRDCNGMSFVSVVEEKKMIVLYGEVRLCVPLNVTVICSSSQNQSSTSSAQTIWFLKGKG